jgi:4-aminobutyrate aminotransferase-like enzyme
MSSNDLLARRKRVMGEAALFYKTPIHLVRGEGVWLYGEDGRRYLDLYNNVPCVGHCHPRVVAALHEQASTLNVHSRYLHEGVVEYSERLLARHADALTSLILCCTGTEANDVAMQMARCFTGGKGFICSNATYHGNSELVFRLFLGPQGDDIRTVPFPQTYRPLREGASESELLELHLEEVRKAVADFDSRGVPLAGMLFCPIFANEGLPDVPAGFMAGAAEIVRKAGGVVILDEVQAGFGRTGRWWGYEVAGCVPDIATMGKPMGAGLPLAGIATSPDVLEAFQKQKFYFNTTASTPLQAAVGLAVLDVIEEEGLVDSAARVGSYLKGELAKIQERCEPMAEVRGHGLFVGVEWVKDRATKEADVEGVRDVVERLKDKGFLTSNAGHLQNVLKVRPPLVFQQAEADLFLTAFDEALRENHGAS